VGEVGEVGEVGGYQVSGIGYRVPTESVLIFV